MFRLMRYALLVLIATLAACGGGESTAPEYSITLTDMSLSKKGGTEALTVNDLPAQGATLTGPGRVRPKR